jgi:hypothetical protein
MENWLSVLCLAAHGLGSVHTDWLVDVDVDEDVTSSFTVDVTVPPLEPCSKFGFNDI